MRYTIIFVALLALTGCASSPISPDEAAAVPPERIHSHGEQTRERTAAVQITRDSGMGSEPCHVHVAIDRERVASLDTGETVRVWVQPGSHIVSAQNHEMMCGFGPFETQVMATEDNPARVRVFWTLAGGFGISPTAY